MAVASLAVGMTGISASAYENSASTILRNVPGAPGNVTSANLKIAVTSNGNYGTSYGFGANISDSKVTVTIVNAANSPSVELTPNEPSAVFYNISVNSSVYASFNGVLSGPSGQYGTWYVYHE